MSSRLASFDQKRTELTPGTVLVREWDRQSQRVMVMADGFAWNGRTYDSLSKVAFAITGTKWNGPRFFGLRAGVNRPDEIEGKTAAHPHAEYGSFHDQSRRKRAITLSRKDWHFGTKGASLLRQR